MIPEGAHRFGPPSVSPGRSLISPGARRWYGGGLVGLIWLVNEGFDLLGQVEDAGGRAAIVVLLVVYSIAFLMVPPLNWAIPQRWRWLPPTALWALSFTLFPWLGFGVASLWVYIGVALAMSMLPFRAVLAYVVVLTACAAFAIYASGGRGETLFYLPAITASVSLMMAAFARALTGMNQLRATQHELARLAVDQERSRVARDMHDILGHSLTVITVKAELAGRLVASDPARAAAEISELEALARGALADVRSTVSGYRGISVASELANARSALESAGVVATLPGSVDAVRPEYRELFGWVVREGITNVLRHAAATRCVVELGSDFVQVTDDGAAGTAKDGTDGSGLAGLRERADAVGLRLTAGPTSGGGYRLRVGP